MRGNKSRGTGVSSRACACAWWMYSYIHTSTTHSLWARVSMRVCRCWHSHSHVCILHVHGIHMTNVFMHFPGILCTCRPHQRKRAQRKATTPSAHMQRATALGHRDSQVCHGCGCHMCTRTRTRVYACPLHAPRMKECTSLASTFRHPHSYAYAFVGRFHIRFRICFHIRFAAWSIVA